jgi:hypothetical protein
MMCQFMCAFRVESLPHQAQAQVRGERALKLLPTTNHGLKFPSELSVVYHFR